MSATAKRLGAIVTRPQALSALALAASTLLGHSLAQAATEEELKAVKLYGNVTIAQDSSSDWGPWTTFEPPAAGRDVNVLNAFSKPELYRPLAQATQPNQPTPEPLGLGCAGGSICGFGAFSISPSEGLVYIGNDMLIEHSADFSNDVPDIHPVLMTGTVIQASTGNDSLPALIPVSLSITSKPLTTGAPLLPESGELTIHEGKGFYYSRGASTSPTTGESYRIGALYPDGGGADPTDTQLVVVDSTVNLTTYLSGEGDYEGQRQDMWGVLGLTTPDDDSTVSMKALRASNATASYDGYSFDHAFSKATNSVHIDVNFGDSTWSGSWNGGKDGNVSTYQATSGGTILQGQVGFLAEGKISGVNINATKISTLDADTTAISGTVKGAFFGPNAAAVGGVVDITKTRPVPTQAGVSVQVESEGSRPYGTGRYVAPFIAPRTELQNNDK